MDEATNKTIKEIEIRTKQWRFSNLSEQLYIWFDRFNERFFNIVLKPPVISFEKTSSRTLGHYVIGRNAFGLKWNININRRYVGLDLAIPWQLYFMKPSIFGKKSLVRKKEKEAAITTIM